MSEESVVVKNRTEHCDCDRPLWVIPAKIVIVFIGAVLSLVIAFGMIQISTSRLAQTFSISLAFVLGWANFALLFSFFRHFCIGQSVYMFTDVEGAKHVHLTKPQLIGTAWYFRYTDQLHNRRAVEISGLILKLRNRGIWRKCQVIYTQDTSNTGWRGLKCWTPDGPCTAYDYRGESITFASADELFHFMQRYTSSVRQARSQQEHTLIQRDCLGIGLYEVILWASQTRSATRSAIAGEMRRRLENLLQNAKVPADERKHWRDEAQRRADMQNADAMKQLAADVAGTLSD